MNIQGGEVTGQVNNPSATAFNGDPFLFVTEGGAVEGWRPALGNTAEILVAGSSANSYDGSTLVTVNGNEYLLAANHTTGNIDVFNGTAGQPGLPGNFKDPNLPAGFVPYNVQVLNGVVYVTYEKGTSGIVDAFSTSGNFLARVGTGGSLDQPWGLAIAPSSFGSLAGDLLVGNKGNGEISIFNPGHRHRPWHIEWHERVADCDPGSLGVDRRQRHERRQHAGHLLHGRCRRLQGRTSSAPSSSQSVPEPSTARPGFDRGGSARRSMVLEKPPSWRDVLIENEAGCLSWDRREIDSPLPASTNRVIALKHGKARCPVFSSGAARSRISFRNSVAATGSSPFASSARYKASRMRFLQSTSSTSSLRSSGVLNVFASKRLSSLYQKSLFLHDVRVHCQETRRNKPRADPLV